MSADSAGGPANYRRKLGSLVIVLLLLVLAIALPVFAGAPLASVAVLALVAFAMGLATGLLPGLFGTILAVILIGVGVGLSTSWFGSSGVGAWGFSFAAGLGAGLRIAARRRRLKGHGRGKHGPATAGEHSGARTENDG
jgi:hypothetical protein